VKFRGYNARPEMKSPGYETRRINPALLAVVVRVVGERVENGFFAVLRMTHHRRCLQLEVPPGRGFAMGWDQAVRTAAAVWRLSSATAVSRILYFWILPVMVIGKLAVNFQ
jgi:hypothetical protein